jgi:hypothetical protein
MAGSSKKMGVSNEEVLYELLEENEYSGISASGYISDTEINVNILLGGEQSVSSDEAESVSDSSSMGPDVWVDLGDERPHFPFTGKPGRNVDLEDPSNSLEYIELFCTPDIAELIAR